MDPLWLAAVVAILVTVGGSVYLHEWINRRLAGRRLADHPSLDQMEFGHSYFGETERRARLAAELRGLVAQYVPYRLDRLYPDASFVADLRMDQLDSLCLVQLANEIEGRYGIELSDADSQSIVTFRNLVDHLDARLDGGGEGLDNDALEQTRRDV